MNAVDIRWFGEEMQKLSAAYPGFKMDRDLWRRTAERWFEGLKEFSREVITAAFDEAPKQEETRTFFPSMGAVFEICVIQRRTISKSTAQERAASLIPDDQPSAKPKAEALRDFFEHVEDCRSRELGRKITDDNSHFVEKALILLGVVYGFPASEAHGVGDGRDPKGFDWIRNITHDFKLEDLSPMQAISGMAKAPQFFKKHPIWGMLLDLCRNGEPTGYWPAEFLKPQKEGSP